jgi:hypothetical protein
MFTRPGWPNGQGNWSARNRHGKWQGDGANRAPAGRRSGAGREFPAITNRRASDQERQSSSVRARISIGAASAVATVRREVCDVRLSVGEIWASEEFRSAGSERRASPGVVRASDRCHPGAHSGPAAGVRRRCGGHAVAAARPDSAARSSIAREPGAAKRLVERDGHRAAALAHRPAPHPGSLRAASRGAGPPRHVGRGVPHTLSSNLERFELSRLAARAPARPCLVYGDLELGRARHPAHGLVAAAHADRTRRPAPAADQLQHEAAGARSDWGLDRCADTSRGCGADRALGGRYSGGKHAAWPSAWVAVPSRKVGDYVRVTDSSDA